MTEDTKEPGEGGQRFLISDGMRDGFIPHRMQILIDYLNTGKAPVRSQYDFYGTQAVMEPSCSKRDVINYTRIPPKLGRRVSDLASAETPGSGIARRFDR